MIRIHVALQLLLAFWIVWVGNAWAFRHSWRIDLTRDQRYAIAPETTEFLRALPKRVEIIVPYSFGSSAADRIRARVFARAIRTIEEFELVNPYCRLEENLNIARDPLRWESLRNEKSLGSPNRIYLFAGDRRETITFEDLAEMRETPNGPVLERERVPEALAAALERVVHDDAPRWLFSQGHGEISPTDAEPRLGVASWVRDLAERGVSLESSDLRQGGAIPDGIDVLVVIAGGNGEAPFDPFSSEVRGDVERFLDRGGDLLLMLPFYGECGLEPLLAPMGIEFRNGLVHSGGGDAASGIGSIQVWDYDEQHPITKRFRFEEDKIELNSFRSLVVTPPAIPLVTTSPDTWLEFDLDGVHDASEPAGPFPVVACLEGSPDSGRGRVVVFGSWTPVLDVFHRSQSRRLLLSACDWLAEREGPTVGVGRVDASDRVNLTADEGRFWFWLTIFAFPGSALAVGLGVWGLRRRA